MAHTNFTESRGGLEDAQSTEEFDFVIPNIPGGSGVTDRDLAVICQQAVYPGRSNEIMEVEVHSGKLMFSGKARMPNTMSIAYIERYDMLVTNTFQEWFEFQRGTNSGVAGGYKREYAVDGAVLIKYDVTGAVADVITFYGLQPADLPDQQLDVSSSNAYIVTVEFRYDFYESRNVSLR